jgi:hypothetical protein
MGTEPLCPSVSVDFSPTPASTPQHQPVEVVSLRRSSPSFNADGSYFTPAFILDVDRVLPPSPRRNT